MDWLTAKRPLVIAHRGASADAPENTLGAFALAVAQGADAIELDVRLSADGWPVIMHDERVDRTTSGSGRVSAMQLSELRALVAADGEPAPTLDDLFEMLGPQVLYNIELKTSGRADAGLEAAVADRVESHHLQSRVLISSFDLLSLRRAARCFAPTVPLALLRERNLTKYGHKLVTAQADHPHYPLVDAAAMRWAGQRGLRVHVWTVDDETEAIRLAKLGVNGIFTNKPGWLREILD